MGIFFLEQYFGDIFFSFFRETKPSILTLRIWLKEEMQVLTYMWEFHSSLCIQSSSLINTREKA